MPIEKIIINKYFIQIILNTFCTVLCKTLRYKQYRNFEEIVEFSKIKSSNNPSQLSETRKHWTAIPFLCRTPYQCASTTSSDTSNLARQSLTWHSLVYMSTFYQFMVFLCSLHPKLNIFLSLSKEYHCVIYHDNIKDVSATKKHNEMDSRFLWSSTDVYSYHNWNLYFPQMISLFKFSNP